MNAGPDLAYLWGEDAFRLERAARAIATRELEDGSRRQIQRVDPDEAPPEGAEASASAAGRRERALAAIEEALSMLPLFGGGTAVIVRGPGGLLAEKAARERFVGLATSVPEGNALIVVDLIASGARGPAAKGVLREAIAGSGGHVEEFPVLDARGLERWLADEAAALDIRLEPAAARLLTERVGGFVREADVDRRRRTELAHAELEKLALYDPGGTIGTDAVEALVAPSVPGSTWAFLDAVGGRAGRDASIIGERLLAEGTPLPLLVSQLHRRIRELILVREHLDTGAPASSLPRAMKLQPFRAKKLAEQAARWDVGSLEAALGGLVGLDLRGKGISLRGATLQMSERVDGLAVQAWIAGYADGRSAVGRR